MKPLLTLARMDELTSDMRRVTRKEMEALKKCMAPLGDGEDVLLEINLGTATEPSEALLAYTVFFLASEMLETLQRGGASWDEVHLIATKQVISELWYEWCIRAEAASKSISIPEMWNIGMVLMEDRLYASIAPPYGREEEEAVQEIKTEPEPSASTPRRDLKSLN